MLTADRSEQVLEQQYAAKVYQYQGGSQSAVDQGAADDDIDVPQPVAQDGNRDEERLQDQERNVEGSAYKKTEQVWKAGLAHRR